MMIAFWVLRVFTGLELLLGVHAAVTISWISSPIRPGETAMVAGGGFSYPDHRTTVLLRSADGSEQNITAFDVSHTALKFQMPTTAQSMAYDLVIGDSEPVPLNSPDVWW